MKLHKLLLAVMLVAGLVLSGAGAALAAPAPQLPPGEHHGLFGSISAVDTDSITLEAARGPVTISVGPDTTYRVPGRESVSFDDLQVGDRLAVLALKSGEDLVALKVMVVPGQPQTQHRVGVITDIQALTITITDKDGNTITLDVPGGTAGLALGQLVTGIVRHDRQTGRPVVRALSQVGRVMDRLRDNLQRLEREDGAGAGAKNIQRLRHLLQENSTRQMSILRAVAERVPEAARPHIRKAMELTQQGLREALKALSLGKPNIELAGRIAAVDPAAGTVTIEPRRGDPLTLHITDQSKLFKDKREPATLADLQVGDIVVAVRYEPESLEVVSLAVKSPRTVEVEGIVAAVDASQGTVTVLTEKGHSLILTVTDASQIIRDGAPATLADIVAGDIVEEAEFNEGTLKVERLVVLSLAQARGQEVEFIGTIEGFDDTQWVVSGRTVLIDQDTEIEGRPRLSARAKVKALVQADGSLSALEVTVILPVKPKVRAVAGTIQAVDVESSQVTILPRRRPVAISARPAGTPSPTTAAADTVPTVTLKVTPSTRIQRNGEPATLADLVVGDVVKASFVPVTKEALHIAARAKKEIERVAFSGTIESLSPDEWVVAGRQVVIDERTHLQVKGVLQVGMTAHVVGILQEDDTVLAREIKVRMVRPEPQEQEISGTLESFNRSQWVVSGQVVKIGPNTKIDVEGHLQVGATVKVGGGAPARWFPDGQGN